MSGKELYRIISSRLKEIRGEIKLDHDMSKLTTAKVGGPADIFFQPADEEDLVKFLKSLPSDIPVMAIGRGSNLIIRDKGIEGVVIKLPAAGFGQIEILDGSCIRVGAAVPDYHLANAAMKAAIGGLEFYSGIPGRFGGAIRMNAGTNKGDVVDRDTACWLKESVVIDRNGDRSVLSNEELEFGYRSCSVAKDTIFISAVLQGYDSDAATIKTTIEKMTKNRKDTQPQGEKTCGSTFKNPNGMSAWSLIDEAGARNFVERGAKMHSKHCNFMINNGNATALDLETLGERIRTAVLENSGVSLEWEVLRVGRKDVGS